MKYIYESPDGKSIYRREFNSTVRELVQSSPHDPYKDIDWNHLVKLAQSTPALKYALDQLLVIYNLSKHE